MSRSRTGRRRPPEPEVPDWVGWLLLVALLVGSAWFYATGVR